MIREVKVEEEKYIQNILQTVFLTQYKEDIFSKSFALYENGQIVGFIIYSFIYDRIELNYIYIDESERNKGFASKLMYQMIAYANDKNAINITLEVNVHNECAIKLYQKFGFTICATREGYYHGEDGYLMIRK